MKTIKRYYVLFICLVLFPLMASAQQENLDWEAKSYLVSIDGHDVEIKSNLDKQGGTFTWEQVSNLSSRALQYNVTSVSGTWDAQQSIGDINYALSSPDDSATLTIVGTTEEITMEFSILDGNGNTLKNYVFTIDTFTNL